MNKIRFSWLTFLLAAFLLSFVTAAAQKSKEPFVIGETLEYEAKYSRLLLRGIDVADLSFKVASDPQQKNCMLFQAEAASKGGLMKLVSYSMRQKFDSTVEMTGNYRILQTIRYDEQDERIRQGEAKFDYLKEQLTYSETDPKNPNAAPRMIMSELDAPAQDLVSAFYYLRRQPLEVGKNLTVAISDAGVVYQIPVRVVARERITTLFGKVWTLRVEPEIFGEKRLINDNEGKLTVWFTEDARHIPVRAQVQSKIGKIEIKLRRADGLQAL